VDEYDFNGNLLRVWAANTHAANFPGGDEQPPVASALGFSEPTGIVFSTIPEPSSMLMAIPIVGLLVGFCRRR
jgi:hypothetical protein